MSGLDDVMARMKELATNRGDVLRRSKRDRSALKSTFRDLLGVVEVRCTSGAPTFCTGQNIARRYEGLKQI